MLDWIRFYSLTPPDEQKNICHPSCEYAASMSSSITTSLLTDMYELTMVDATLQSGTWNRQVTFELFGRRLPPARRFGVMAGNARIIEALERFEFSKDEIDYLSREKIVSDD